MASANPVSNFSGQGQKIGTFYSFCSAGRVGTGALETIPHGLGRRPTFIIAQVDDESAATAILGVTTKDNVLVTVTNGQTYSLLLLV